MKVQPLPNIDFVTLTEALTFIAFGRALNRDDLKRAIAENEFAPLDHEPALADAMARLAEQASGGHIRMRGKKVAHHSVDDSKILTTDIEPICLADFAQYDSLYDGLRCGTGLTWAEQDGNVHRATRKRPESYRYVTVNRSDLLDSFPPSRIKTISTANAETECRAWLLVAFEADPDKRRTRQSFQDEALERFRGRISQRGFLRVWADVAPQAGRSMPGRKSKR